MSHLTKTRHLPLSLIFHSKARPPKRNSKKVPDALLSAPKPCLLVSKFIDMRSGTDSFSAAPNPRKTKLPKTAHTFMRLPPTWINLLIDFQIKFSHRALLFAKIMVFSIRGEFT